MNEAKDAKMNWLESYVDQSVTFSSWRKVEAKLCQVLKQNLEKKLMDPVNRQILFQILGNDFVHKYFSSYTNSPAILDNIRPEERAKKTAEMKTLVTSVVDSTLQKKGPKSDGKVQADLVAFSQDLQNTIDADFEDQYSEAKSKKKQKSGLPEKYLAEILSDDPSMIESLLPELRAHFLVLSDNLRQIIWAACLSSKEKSKNKRNSEKVKEKFVQLYVRRNNYSDDSKDSRNIASSVNKVYKETKCMKSLDSEENINSATTLLDINSAYGRTFQLHYVYYAAVIQQIYVKHGMKASDEEYGTGSMMLEKVLRLCVLNTDRCNKIVDKIRLLLEETDKQLIDLIKQKLSIQRDSKNANSEERVYESVSSEMKEPADDPASYLKKWILDGFGSVLKPNALYFIWDQLFLNKWENKFFQDACLALLGLLKPWFMLCRSKSDVQRVFLEEPSVLYLMDIRKALSHVQKKGSFLEIPKMNRNIKYSQEPVPVPSPSPVPEPEIAPPIPPPKPVIPLPKFIPWVPHNKEKVIGAAQGKSKVDQPFDLYIDSVRFVPDNSTAIKVTGKVLNMYLGQKDKSIKFQAFPELESHWRYPSFKLKQVINRDSIPMNPDVVIMMRLYTIEQHSKKICVLGSCLFGPFSNKHGKQATLREGGHQIRVRHGIPDPDFNVEHMLASHMDDNPVIPGVTILLRVLPQGKDYVPTPEYETNYYRSEIAKPNESENKLYKYYQNSKDLSMTVRDVALLMCGQASANDETLKQLLQQKLQKEGSDVEDFPYQRYVNYDKAQGMMVLVDKASGLPIFLEGRYLQCLVQVFPGEDTKIGSGKNQVISFVTEELELDSPQRAPDWSDEPKKVHPECDDHAFILACLYGLRPRYDTSNGKLLDKEGREPKFNLDQAIAWSATTCFNKGAVYAGVHHIPLLKGRPPDDIIEKLSYLPLNYLCKKFKSQVKVFEAASIEISIWDGRFLNSECPPLPVHTEALNISSNPAKYIKASERRSGATALDLLRLSLSDPSEFNRRKAEIVNLLREAFKSNLDVSLTKSGYSTTV